MSEAAPEVLNKTIPHEVDKTDEAPTVPRAMSLSEKITADLDFAETTPLYQFLQAMYVRAIRFTDCDVVDNLSHELYEWFGIRFPDNYLRSSDTDRDVFVDAMFRGKIAAATHHLIKLLEVDVDDTTSWFIRKLTLLVHTLRLSIGTDDNPVEVEEGDAVATKVLEELDKELFIVWGYFEATTHLSDSGDVRHAISSVVAGLNTDSDVAHMIKNWLKMSFERPKHCLGEEK